MPPERAPDLQAIVEEIHAELAPRFGEGKVADYIPQLARVDPRRFGLAVVGLDGGVHAAGLADADGTLSVVREDVGRHNAVDKVVGAKVLAGEPPAAACLVLSGRVGFELVQKAAAVGIGSIVAVGAPTSLAARLAADAGIALWGFTSAGRTVNYC